MDDNRTNPEENQPVAEEPKPIFETVEERAPSTELPPDLTPEEIAPEVSSPEEASSTPPPEMDNSQPPVYQESRMKYVVVGLAVVVFFLIFFFIISRLLKGVGAKKEVKLVYWGLWEEKEIFDPLINEYQSKNTNVKIEYQKMSPQEYQEKLVARSKNGQGPDIFRFHNTWLPQIAEVASQVPANIMSNAEFEKNYYPVIQKDLKVGNYYYGLPLMIDGLVLIYNDDMFKKAGIGLAPSTWEDIINNVGQLSVKDKDGSLITSGIALGTASNIEHFSDILGLMFVQNGADLKKLDSPEAATALEAYRKFAEPPNNVWDETMPNSITAFIEGKTAMIIAPSWQVLTIKSANPEINLKVVPVPAVPGGRSLSLASYWVEGVSRFSKNQLEAWKFLRFLSEKESLTKLYEMEAKFRLFGEPYPRIDLGQSLVQNEYVGAVIKQADSYFSLPLASRTFDNGLNDSIIQYLENAVNATIQGVSYSEALTTAKQGVDQIFSRYKIE